MAFSPFLDFFPGILAGFSNVPDDCLFRVRSDLACRRYKTIRIPCDATSSLFPIRFSLMIVCFLTTPFDLLIGTRQTNLEEIFRG